MHPLLILQYQWLRAHGGVNNSVQHEVWTIIITMVITTLSCFGNCDWSNATNCIPARDFGPYSFQP